MSIVRITHTSSSGNNPKNWEIQSKISAISIKYSENLVNLGQMSNILVKWLHYLWLFPDIWHIQINLLHLCDDFFLKVWETPLRM